MSSAPWDIYAEQLTPLRYGYPLWVPDPSPGKPPVQLGDVGWIREGQFLPLFNVFRDADDNQPRGAVPSGFTPLNLSDITVEGPREKISQKVVCSRSIRQNDVSGGVGASGPSPSFPSWNVEFAFRCREDSGAFLVPYPSVMAHDILSKLRIEAYILSNFDSWLDFANSTLELGLKEEDLRFVCGRKMTIRWAVAAFQGRYRNKSGSITGALGAVTGSANLSMTISDESLPASHYRVGPPDPVPGGSQPTLLPEDGDSSNSPPAPSDVFNQCVFIHYYKRKKRLPFFPAALKASAGPHELPPCSDDSQAQMLLHGSSAASSAGDDISLSEYYASSDIFDDTPTVADPVDAILGYILENSDATVALSSDVDLHELLPDLVQWPDDLRNSLSDLKPVIDVNENGVGTIRCPSLDAWPTLLEEMSFAGSAHNPRQGDDSPGSSSPIPTDLHEPMTIDPSTTSSGAPSRTPSPSRWNTLTVQRYPMFDERNLSTDLDSETSSVGSAMSWGSPLGHEEMETNWFARGFRNEPSASSSTRQTTEPFSGIPMYRTASNRGSGPSGEHSGESSDGGMPKGGRGRKETLRRMQTQDEQRRRDELRDGYARLKEAVFPAGTERVKLSKPDLLTRAWDRILALEREGRELQRRLAELEAERAILSAHSTSHTDDEMF